MAVMWTWNRPSSKSPQQISVTRSILPMPGRAVFDGDDLALSPDGTHLAYVISHGVDGLRLYVQALDEFEPRLIAGADTPQRPFFSPDSQWLGFSDSGKLKRVAVSGGAPQTICDTPAVGGATWATDDTIVFSPHLRSGLFRVPAGGGTPQVMTSLRPGEKSHRLPQVLPGGKSVLFTIIPSNIRSFDDAQIAVASVDSGQMKVLRERGTNPRFVPTGHLLYLRGLSLIAAPFDPRREEVIGRSVAVLDGVSSVLDGGSVLAAVDDHGLLAYLRGTVFGSDNRLVWVDRQGRIEPLIDTLGAYSGVSLSPDGQTLAIDIMAANDQIWLYNLARRTMTELTYDWDNEFPIWAPDGKRVAFESDRAGPFNFYWQNRDGSGSIERLTVSPRRQGGGSWLPDGKGFAYVDSSPRTDWDIWLLSLASGRPTRPLIEAPFNQWFATFSPDGRWLAYVSDETGQSEVFVQPYPSLDAKWHISSGGGTHPKWGKHELYYRTGRQFMAVPFRTEPTFVPESPQLLFSGEFADGYDVAPDGRFIMIQVAPDVSPAREITLVHNWTEELKQRVLTR
jgi:serine/threonine-protein kinase